MKILDRYFNIFNEGAQDAEFRQRAMDVERKLEDALKHIQPSDVVMPKPGEPTVAVDIGDVLDDDELSGLELWFMGRAEGTSTKRGAFSKNRIVLFVDMPPETVSNIDSDAMKRIVLKHASSILKRAKEIFWHEFVHYMDVHRMNPTTRSGAIKKSSRIGGLKNPEKYFNDPLEYNAFLQAGLSRVEDHLSKISSWEDAQKLIGKTPDEFLKLVLNVIPPQMKKNLNTRYKAKLKKRVAQMWLHTKERFTAAGGR